jgi:hypothetical protein
MIAIAGTSGTGKTELAKSLYELDDRWLQSGWGQGEQMPVFIMEDASASEAQGYLTELHQDSSGQRHTRRRPVDPQEWARAKKGDLAAVLIVELAVPPRLFLEAPPGSAGVLLLPGYEPRPEANRLWMELMRQSLVGASRVLLVTEHADLASAAPDTAMNDLRDDYATGSAPLVAVTHCDQVSRDTLETLSSLAAKRFRRAEDGVFCVGTEPEFDAEIARLRARLSALGFQPGVDPATRLRETENCLARDLGSLLHASRERLDELIDSGGATGERQMRDLLRHFDDGHSELRRVYGRQLDVEVEGIRMDARRRIKQLHPDRFEGFAALRKRAVLRISLRPSKVRDEREKLIVDAWTGGGRSPIADAMPRILATAVGRQLEAEFGAGFRWLPEQFGEEESTAVTRPEGDTRYALAVMEMVRLMDRPELFLRPDASLAAAVRLLPALTLEWAHMGSLLPGLVGLPDLGLPEDRTITENAAELTELLESWDEVQRELVRVWASMAGIETPKQASILDLKSTLDALAAAASGGKGAALGRAVASAVSGGAAATATVAIALEMINHRLNTLRSVAEMSVDRIAANEIAHRKAAFEELMEMSRRILSAKLRRRYQVDDDFARQEWLRWLMRSVHTLRHDLLEEIRDDLRSLG